MFRVDRVQALGFKALGFCVSSLEMWACGFASWARGVRFGESVDIWPL